MTDTFPQPDEGSVETYPLGVRRYSIQSGEITVVVGTKEARREAIDEWANVLSDTILEMAATGGPVYVLSDTTAQGQGLTYYARRRIMDIHTSLPPDVDVFGAMLLPGSVMAQFISVFIENMMRITSKKLHARTFTDREKALDWLNRMRSLHG